ncbi:hypothetical protein C8R46DRAFT_1088009 [Mycena filopes]|nr:hypothetical protein C8R46DRAFT_1088009 [Mycena filopes]
MFKGSTQKAALFSCATPHIRPNSAMSITQMHINSFPAEILTRFLRSAIIGSVHDDPDPTRRRKIALAVCRYWRDAGNADPTIWSHITIDNYTPLIDLHSWLAKSGSVPLTFTILLVDTARLGRQPPMDVPEYVAWLSATLKHFLPRCEALRLYTTHEEDSVFLLRTLRSSDMSHLVSLDLDVVPPTMSCQRLPPDSFLHRALPPLLPQTMCRLEEATFNFSLPLWKWSGALGSLTTVSFSRMWGPHIPTIDEVHTFFAAAPRVEHLQLSMVDCEPSSNPQSPMARQTLAALTHLDLSLLSTSSIALVASLHLPQVRTLRLEVWQGTDLPVLLNECAPLLASITTAVVLPHIKSSDQLADLLHSMPQLIRLDGRRGMSFFSEAFHNVCLHRERLCPQLSAVVLPSFWDYSVIEDILLYADPGNFSKSLSLYISFPISSYVFDCFPTSFRYDSSSSSILRRPVDTLLDYYALPILPLPVTSTS